MEILYQTSLITCSSTLFFCGEERWILSDRNRSKINLLLKKLDNVTLSAFYLIPTDFRPILKTHPPSALPCMSKLILVLISSALLPVLVSYENSNVVLEIFINNFDVIFARNLWCCNANPIYKMALIDLLHRGLRIYLQQIING